MIKIIAFSLMVLDHMGFLFFPEWTFLRVLGRLSLPLFAYEIAQGYTRTKNVKIYIIRIFLLAILSQIPYYLIFNNGYLNVLFTLGIGLVIILIINSSYKLVVKIIYIFFLIFIVDVLYFEYGIYCLLMIVVFYLFEERYAVLIVAQLLVTLFGVNIYEFPSYQLMALLSIPLIMLLRYVDFKIPKIISYSFYPAHLIIFLIVRSYFY